jgi:TRAP-type C4-dicarboxylate transport system permease small subunit
MARGSGVAGEKGDIRREGIAPAAEAAAGRIVGAIARLLAILGGGLLVGLAVMSVVSITGRAFSRIGLGPVPGDFELIEAGCAVAVFAFLPWCQFRGGNVTVDLLEAYLPARFWAWLAVAGNLAMTVAAVILSWQLWLGFRDKLAYGETSMILQMPVWWGYAAGVASAIVFVVTCFYTIWRSVNQAISGKQSASGAHI